MRLGAVENENRITTKHIINRDNGQSVFYGLTNQHPIKGITVNGRKPGKLTHTGFIEGQTGNLVAGTLGREVVLW